MWSKVRDDLPLYALAVLLTGVFAFFAGPFFPAKIGFLLTMVFMLLLISRMGD